MSIVVLDSGAGGYDFIKKIKNELPNLEIKFLKILNNNSKKWNDKDYIKKICLDKINKLSKNTHFIIIACHSASSTILDIIIKNNFIFNNIPIFEPILPMCLFIKEHKYKNILVLSTKLTQKVRWHHRILNSNDTKVKYITFPLLAEKIENENNVSECINRLKNQKGFITRCDCVVLGCTHYNIKKNLILKELRTKYSFKGIILDSNEILLKYFKNVAF